MIVGQHFPQHWTLRTHFFSEKTHENTWREKALRQKKIEDMERNHSWPTLSWTVRTHLLIETHDKNAKMPKLLFVFRQGHVKRWDEEIKHAERRHETFRKKTWSWRKRNEGRRYDKNTQVDKRIQAHTCRMRTERKLKGNKWRHEKKWEVRTGRKKTWRRKTLKVKTLIRKRYKERIL